MKNNDFNFYKIVFFVLFTISLNVSGQTLVHNFEFNGDFNDTTTATVLTENNTATSSFGTNPNSWSWTQPSNPGGGLVLLTDQLTDPAKYSIGFRIEFDDIVAGVGYKKILSFLGEADDKGFYFHGTNLDLYPFGDSSGVTFAANTLYDFVLTRDIDGKMKVYIVEADGTVSDVYDVTDNTNVSIPRDVGGKREFRFFMDDTHTNTEHTTGGTVHSIRLWDYPLSAQDIKDALSSVSTGSATNITNVSADLDGIVNPQGTASTFEFNWGLTAAYGNVAVSTPGSSLVSTSVNLQASIADLTPGTTYHYRVKSTNGSGDTFGSDKTFTTTAPPTAICQDFTAQLGAAGSITILPSDIDDGSSDPDGAVTLSLDQDTFDCSNVGTPVVVTLTVTDGSGDVDTCTSTVTVEDSIAPIITCPADKTENSGGDYTLPNYWGVGVGDVTVTDNCDTFIDMTITQNPAAGTVMPSGAQYTITMTATDISLNSSTCTFELAVDTALGVEGNEFSSDVKVFSNHHQGISILNLPEDANYKIYSVLGRQLKEGVALKNSHTISGLNLATGIYILKIEGIETGKKLTKKLVL